MFSLRASRLLTALLSLALVYACGDSDNEADSTAGVVTESTTTAGRQSGSPTQRSATSAPPERAVHACDLISPEEVSAAVGFTVGSGRDYLAAARGATQCEWTGAGVVYAEVLTKGGESWFKAVHIPNSALPEVEIPGLGDKALYSNDQNTVDVLSGDRYISVQIIGARAAGVDEQTAGAGVAKAILAKLH